MIIWNESKFKATAVQNTISNEGSQFSLKVKKFIIFDLETIPETISPAPNIIPTIE